MSALLIIGIIIAFITKNFIAILPMTLGILISNFTRHAWASSLLDRPANPLPLQILNILGIGLFIYGVILLF